MDKHKEKVSWRSELYSAFSPMISSDNVVQCVLQMCFHSSDSLGSMDSNSNIYIYFFLFVLCLLPTDLSGAEPICQDQNKTIGCGGIHFKDANHTKRFCQAPLNSRLTLKSCADENANTTVFWYMYTDLCKQNRTQTSYFASMDVGSSAHANNNQCLSLPGITISVDMCNSSFEFTRGSMIIKNLTDELAGHYVCLHGMNAYSILNSSAISYNISIGGE
jgi:hypothetical protein